MAGPEGQMRQAIARYRVARALLEMGDLDAAQEEMRSSLGHLARARLLGDHVYPLSRPELPGQLRALGDDGLAAGVERTSSQGPLPASELEALSALIAGRLEAELGAPSAGRPLEDP